MPKIKNDTVKGKMIHIRLTDESHTKLRILVAVLERFGSLWEVLAEDEKTRLMNELLESVVYDPASNGVSLIFRPKAPSVSS